MTAQPSMTLIGGDAVPRGEDFDAERLNRVFFALSDPVRRAILERLGDGPALVSEIAAPFEISLQAVSKHIQVLVRAGLINQARSGRVAKCSLDIGPVFAAALWLNRYTEYWQAQFDALAVALGDIERREAGEVVAPSTVSGDPGNRTPSARSGARRKTLGPAARLPGKTRKKASRKNESSKRTSS